MQWRCDLSYCAGVELTNGYEELVDADQQLARFTKDNQARAMMGKPNCEIDMGFISALSTGLPECAGVALGLDRLLLLL